MRVLLILIVSFSCSSAFPTETFKVYMSAEGSDYSDGLSVSEPIKSLKKAQEILNKYNPNTSIEIHIAPGTYFNQHVVWTYTNGKEIVFTSEGFSKERPVFDGGGNFRTWFTLRKADGSDSNLTFMYLKIQNYNTAISFEGNRVDISKWNSRNILYGMYFYKIGGAYSRFEYSTAALRFVNSRNNYILNSHFVDISNNSARAHLIHSIYLAHHSSYNLISRNRFVRNSGDPIRVRDQSNFNQVVRNRFYFSGYDAYYSEWYCSPETSREECTKPTPECPSIANEFRQNLLFKGYYGKVRLFKFFGSNGYCQPTRLSTSDNFFDY
ncbi:hypothetical protein ACJJH9_11030 [Microbulbifer sp. DLAB2-AF]|uniref:hypothetical protein n=1 Tax=Microbulbifer sp. DLAB2-AF TaxID=3243395 RepID=UPI00403A59F4